MVRTGTNGKVGLGVMAIGVLQGGFVEMNLTPEDIEENLQHQRSLLQTYTKNLRRTEEQIANYDPSLVPIHLLNNRDAHEAARTEALHTICDLERQKSTSAVDIVPEVNVDFLTSSLPTGVLHLYMRDDLPVLKYTMINPTSGSVSIIVSSWIEQFSYTRSDTVGLDPGQSRTLAQLPTLRLDEIEDITQVRKAVLHTRVSYIHDRQESLLREQDYDIQFLARDVIVWAIIEDAHKVHDLSDHIAAWVTPNASEVVEMLRHAADYSTTGTLVGYQGNGTIEQCAVIVRGQIKAIFEALKQEGRITYVNSPISFGQQDNNVQQRVNLPRDSLRYCQANCIDGAVLYASLIERAAMNPVILMIPGHALVGWEIWRGSGQYEFLETTMTHSHTFEEAVDEGLRQFGKVQQLIGRPLFDPVGFARQLDIKMLHNQGILPAG